MEHDPGGRQGDASPVAPAAPQGPSCAGCVALRDQLHWMQAQLEKAQERALQFANPQVATALGAGVSPPTAKVPEPPIERFVIEDKEYVLYQGRPLLASDWEKMQAGQGFIDTSSGRFVPNEEYDRAMTKLDEMTGAGRA